MKKIVFLCHGNICRSPMAEFIMKDLLKKRGMADGFVVESAAVTASEEGNGIYPPARRTLTRHGIPFTDHRSHKITAAEAASYDMIVVMDASNLRLLRHIVGDNGMKNVRTLLDRDVADPWYTNDFETAYSDILKGCTTLCDRLALGK